MFHMVPTFPTDTTVVGRRRNKTIDGSIIIVINCFLGQMDSILWRGIFKVLFRRVVCWTDGSDGVQAGSLKGK